MQVLKKDFERLKYYIDEKERLLKEIDYFSSMLSTGYKSPDFTEPKKVGGNYDATYNLIFNNIKIKKHIEKRLKKIEVIILKLYKIIEKIEDPELRSIVELRAIKGMTWEEIGEELFMEKTTAFKKYKNFIDS